MALEAVTLIFAVLDVSFNSGHYTVIIERQFLYINIFSFSTIFICMLAPNASVTRTGRSKFNGRAKGF